MITFDFQAFRASETHDTKVDYPAGENPVPGHFPIYQGAFRARASSELVGGQPLQINVSATGCLMKHQTLPIVCSFASFLSDLSLSLSLSFSLSLSLSPFCNHCLHLKVSHWFTKSGPEATKSMLSAFPSFSRLRTYSPPTLFTWNPSTFGGSALVPAVTPGARHGPTAQAPTRCWSETWTMRPRAEVKW